MRGKFNPSKPQNSLLSCLLSSPQPLLLPRLRPNPPLPRKAPAEMWTRTKLKWLCQSWSWKAGRKRRTRNKTSAPSIMGSTQDDKFFSLCVHARSLQSCLTLCDSVDGSPPDSSVHGILQPRILEWVAIPFLRVSSQPRD